MGGKYNENVCNNGDFEVEEGVEVEAPGPAMRPGDGYTWSRQVVLKIKIILLEISNTIILISIIITITIITIILITITIILITPIIIMMTVLSSPACVPRQVDPAHSLRESGQH